MVQLDFFFNFTQYAGNLVWGEMKLHKWDCQQKQQSNSVL